MSQRVSTIESGISNHYHQASLLSPGRSRSALCSPASLFILMIMPASHKQVHTDYSQKPQEEARAAFTKAESFLWCTEPKAILSFPKVKVCYWSPRTTTSLGQWRSDGWIRRQSRIGTSRETEQSVAQNCEHLRNIKLGAIRISIIVKYLAKTWNLHLENSKGRHGNSLNSRPAFD